MRRFLCFAAFMACGHWALAENLPVPPVPPAQPPISEAAPVPNVNAEAPVAPASNEVKLDVKFYRARTYDASKGFVPGSRYQSNEDRKPIQTPGFSVSVPLK
jgi:hypothetical protein